MTVLFLHVPKAAGTSYALALARALDGPSLMVDIPGTYSSEEFQQVDPETLRPYGLVGAHVDYGLCRRAPWLAPVTVLRDPVDRIVSWYHYVLRDEGASLRPWRRFIEQRRLSVEEFLLHPQLRWLQGQAETMQIAGYLWSGDELPYVDDLVPEAVANLSTFAHFGLYERLGDSLRLARAELGLGAVPTLPDENVSPPRPRELDPDVRAAVADLIGMDAAFYPAAVAEFERRLAAHGLTGDPTPLPPPVRPPPGEVAPPHARSTTAPASARPPSGQPPQGDPPTPTPDPEPDRQEPLAARPAVGDWLELAWSPEPGTTIGGPLIWPVPLSAPEGAEAIAASAGDSFVLGDPAPLDLGANWVRVPAGLYQVQATVPCRRLGAARAEVAWDLLFDFAWYGDPPIPYVEGLPGAPDLVLWVPQAVPPALPKLPLRGAPVSAGGLLRVPDGGGHLAFLLGSTQPVVVSAGDQVRLRYVKVG